jgi:hypothetical protein
LVISEKGSEIVEWAEKWDGVGRKAEGGKYNNCVSNTIIRE